MSLAGMVVVKIPPPISNQILKFDIHQKSRFCGPVFRTITLKESEIAHRNSLRLIKTMSSGLIVTGNSGGGSDELTSPAVSALEHESLIEVGGASFHQTAGGLQAIVNHLSKWIVFGTYSGFIFLRHDAFTFWASIGCVFNFLLSLTLKRSLKQERPVSRLRSSPGMPSSHAQTLFYTTILLILSLVKGPGWNGVTAIVSVLAVTLGSYFSWLRVSQRYHTMSQVVVGAVVGSVFSFIWFRAWEEIVYKAYNSNRWVRVLLLGGVACFYSAFVFYAIWDSLNSED